MVVGLGNGLAFVPLTALALSGVEPQDAGAASGLVNVTQQVGAALGLAVLVTVFGSASRSSLTHASGTAEAARAAFVHGADVAFLVAAGFLVATLVLVSIAIRPARERRDLADELELDLDLATAEAEGSPPPADRSSW